MSEDRRQESSTLVAEHQVFADESGRRGLWLRRLGRVVGIGCLVYMAVVGATVAQTRVAGRVPAVPDGGNGLIAGLPASTAGTPDILRSATLPTTRPLSSQFTVKTSTPARPVTTTRATPLTTAPLTTAPLTTTLPATTAPATTAPTTTAPTTTAPTTTRPTTASSTTRTTSTSTSPESTGTPTTEPSSSGASETTAGQGGQ